MGQGFCGENIREISRKAREIEGKPLWAKGFAGEISVQFSRKEIGFEI